MQQVSQYKARVADIARSDRPTGRASKRTGDAPLTRRPPARPGDRCPRRRSFIARSVPVHGAQLRLISVPGSFRPAIQRAADRALGARILAATQRLRHRPHERIRVRNTIVDAQSGSKFINEVRQLLPETPGKFPSLDEAPRRMTEQRRERCNNLSTSAVNRVRARR